MTCEGTGELTFFSCRAVAPVAGRKGRAVFGWTPNTAGTVGCTLALCNRTSAEDQSKHPDRGDKLRYSCQNHWNTMTKRLDLHSGKLLRAPLCASGNCSTLVRTHLPSAGSPRFPCRRRASTQLYRRHRPGHLTSKKLPGLRLQGTRRCRHPPPW